MEVKQQMEVFLDDRGREIANQFFFNEQEVLMKCNPLGKKVLTTALLHSNLVHLLTIMRGLGRQS
ncbi:hypothetical protein DPMN_174403 [Dreissena polymorpha]|uniref:Uncharacterized protein n=1 Tax=Dreissena polymorpha TaxID=45954 RepID=A0A9D4E5V9_DREPO|nr:hypothetical protein DPMN_174368 [Dreissena polymorpha]KAH3773053.1 hypothetical protein DPMN_174403 [Dreissena polymorpha]